MPRRSDARGRSVVVLALGFVSFTATPGRAQEAPTEPARVPDLTPGGVVARLEASEDALGPTDGPGSAVHRAEDWLVDGQRRDAIAHGVVAPYYRELARAMRHGFSPDLAAIADERRRTMSPLGVVVDELTRYGPPEAPHDARGTPTPELRASSPEDIQRLNEVDSHSLLNAHTRWQRVEVHVEQDREGVVTRARVTHRSGSRLLDQEALDAVRETAVARPPEDVIGTRSGFTSDWAFWAGEVVPYVGAMTQGGLTGAMATLSCMDGPEGEGLQCSALGRPLLRTRVELLDVHDAAHERRAALEVPPEDDAGALADPTAP